MDTWRDVDHSLNLRIKLEQKGQKGEKDPIFLVLSESERRGKEESQELPSKIYGVPLIKVRRTKNKSSSHRRGLCVDTENAGFHRGSK